MRSNMVHSFSQVPRANIPRSSFNRSHSLKTTADADILFPILVDDVVPGDTFNVNMSFFHRLTSATVVPLMDNLRFESFFFFVPYRLVWENWEKFCGAQDDPGDSIDYTIPVISGTNGYTGEGSLWDYFGLPLDNKAGAHLDPDDVTVSALPFRAYSLIWDEWFRDQNLQDSIYLARSDISDDGPDVLNNISSAAGSTVQALPLKRGKRHDYFTSCLPWPQKGTAVDLPLGTNAPVYADGVPINQISLLDQNGVERDLDSSGSTVLLENSVGTGPAQMFVDLSSATSATINELRLAFQTQRLLERDARSGTRYNETILAHFGVTVPDYRVQRPEFLGGGSDVVQLTTVPQTTYQGTQTVEDHKGAMAAIGTSSGSHGFTKSFTEHGVIIGLGNFRADITYSQGIDRYWMKQTRYDFYYPVLATIGEQAVTMAEIWTQGDGATTDDTVFGYQERYAEMRYKPSRLTGLMNVDAASNLDEYHLSEDFASQPSLDDSFIESNTGSPLDRAVAVPTQPHFVCDFFFDMKCARPMPLYGVPGNLDHF